MKLILVEGNIGAGKSTFLTLMQKQFSMTLIHEPVDKWQLVGTENLLELFYKDPKRWGYTFQSYAFVSRVNELNRHMQTKKIGTFLGERSIFSDRFCFAKNCYELGYMSRIEWKLYQEWFALLAPTTPQPTAFVYLKTDPQLCHQRISKRSRSEESGITLSYLQRLHELHEAWLVEKKGLPEWLAQVPVLIIDSSQEFENSPSQQRLIIEKIRSFLDHELPKRGNFYGKLVKNEKIKLDLQT